MQARSQILSWGGGGGVLFFHKGASEGMLPQLSIDSMLHLSGGPQ